MNTVPPSAYEVIIRGSRRLALLGDGPSLLEGLRWVLSQQQGYDVACVNRAGLKWCFPFLFWATRHACFMRGWYALRRENQLALPAVVSDSRVPGDGLPWMHATSRGTGSGEYALEVALNLGYEQIALVGFDLSSSYECYAPNFALLKCGAVRALHGMTREIFGAPESGWFKE